MDNQVIMRLSLGAAILLAISQMMLISAVDVTAIDAGLIP
jgi:hypothetical protein